VALILLTNDDGIEAQGLSILEENLEGLCDIVVVAPDRERSAVSHGLTIHSPLKARQINENHYSLNGTPADCVIYALKHILGARPSLVISGINRGANLGDDIMYSGTVAAAREASRRGLPGIAVSQAYDEKPIRFQKGAKFVRLLAKTMLEQASDGGICLNVNIPVHKIRGAKITRQGFALHYPHFNSLDREGLISSTDPQIAHDRRKVNIPLDFQAVVDNFISITPLQRDQTDYITAKQLLADEPRLSRRFRLPGIGLIG
jgi:5'-nucleotidase